MNTQVNIPVYRALKLCTKDEYVEGYYFNAEIEKEHIIMKQVPYEVEGFEYDNNEDEIDPSTLAISFTDMTDSEGTRIFASLSENGKGGDIVESINEFKFNPKALTFSQFHFNITMYGFGKYKPEDLKVIGIQK